MTAQSGLGAHQMERADFVRSRWAISAFFLANGFAMGSWAPHIPLIQQRLDLSEGILGMALFALAAGSMIAMLLSSMLCNWFGSDKVSFVSTVALGLLLIGPPIAPGLLLLFLLACLFGFAVGLMDVAMNAQALAIEKGLDQPVFSSFHGFWSLGGLFGAALAGFAFSIGVSPTVHICAAGALITVSAFYLRLYLIPDPEEAKEPGPKFVIPRGLVLLIACLAFLSMIAEGSILDWGAVFFHSELGAPTDQAAFAYAVFAAAAATGRMLGDQVVARLGRLRVLTYSAWLAVFGLMVISFAPSIPIAFAGCILAGLGIANLIPLLFAAGGRAPGVKSVDGVAAVAMLGYFGFLIGPVFIGLIAEEFSLRVSLSLVGASLVIVPLIAASIFAKLER